MPGRVKSRDRRNYTTKIKEDKQKTHTENQIRQEGWNSHKDEEERRSRWLVHEASPVADHLISWVLWSVPGVWSLFLGTVVTKLHTAVFYRRWGGDERSNLRPHLREMRSLWDERLTQTTCTYFHIEASADVHAHAHTCRADVGLWVGAVWLQKAGYKSTLYTTPPPPPPSPLVSSYCFSHTNTQQM